MDGLVAVSLGWTTVGPWRPCVSRVPHVDRPVHTGLDAVDGVALVVDGRRRASEVIDLICDGGSGAGLSQRQPALDVTSKRTRDGRTCVAVIVAPNATAQGSGPGAVDDLLGSGQQTPQTLE